MSTKTFLAQRKDEEIEGVRNGKTRPAEPLPVARQAGSGLDLEPADVLESALQCPGGGGGALLPMPDGPKGKAESSAILSCGLP